MQQLQQQEQPLEAMRSDLHTQLQAVEAERDRLRADVNDLTEQVKVRHFDVSEGEARFKDWNVRLLSDLDQLYEYYYAVVRDVRGGDEGIAMVMKPESKPDAAESASGESSLKGVMERVADRLQQLTVLKQQHTLSSQALLKKIKSLEANAANTSDMYRRSSEEKDLQLSRLFAEASEAKARQTRLEKALEETRELAESSHRMLQNAAHRLQFFADDLQASLMHMGPAPVAPAGTVTFATVRVEGAAVLWEAEAGVMQVAMTVYCDIIRAKLRQYGGYEFGCDNGAFQIAFHDALEAVRFALEVQEWLLRAKWPRDLLNHNAAREETSSGNIIFRGLRAAVPLHRGEANAEETAQPVGVGVGRTVYYGRTVTELLHLAGFASGGQVVLTQNVWVEIRDRLRDVGNPAASEMGQHRVAIATRNAAGMRGDAFTSSETITLHQLVPAALSARTFARESVDASVSAAGMGIAPPFTQLARGSVATEVASLRDRATEIRRASATLAEEMESVSASVTSLSCKVRDAQVNGRIYSQADIVAHIAAIDRIVARTEVVRRDVERIGTAQTETQGMLKLLEEQILLQSKVNLTEDEYKKKLELINDRATERLHEQRLQHDHQVQQLKNSLARAEQVISDLRRQSVSLADKENDDRKSKSIRESSSAPQAAPLPAAKLSTSAVRPGTAADRTASKAPRASSASGRSSSRPTSAAKR